MENNFNFYYRFSLGFTIYNTVTELKRDEMIRWCEENCKFRFNHSQDDGADLIRVGAGHSFIFGVNFNNKREALAFKLIFGGELE